MSWLLDTNVCIHLIKKRPPAVLQRLREVDIAEVALSAITVAELEYGVARSDRKEQNAIALAAFLAPFVVLPFGEEAASAYGRLRAHLERAGTPIGGLDCLIAAQALATGRTVVTNNLREFARVDGLHVVDWTAP